MLISGGDIPITAPYDTANMATDQAAVASCRYFRCRKTTNNETFVEADQAAAFRISDNATACVTVINRTLIATDQTADSSIA